MDHLPSYVLTILAILPFIISLAIFAVYRYGISLKNTVRGKLENSAEKLRRARTAFRSHERLAQNAYIDEEPYLSKVEAHRDIITVCDRRMRKLHNDYKNLRQGIEDALALQQNIMRSLSQWRVLSSQIDIFDRDLDSFVEEIERLDRLREDIDTLAWQVATEVQERYSQISESGDNLHELTELGWYGEEQVVLQKRVKDLEETLRAQVPLVFLSPDPEIVIQQTDVHDVIRTHRVAASLAEEIEQALLWTSQWLQDARELPALLQESQQRLAKIQQEIIKLENAEFYPVRFDRSTRKLSQSMSLVTDISQSLQQRQLSNLLGSKHKIVNLDSRSDQLAQEMAKTFEIHSAFTVNALAEEFRKAQQILREFRNTADKVSQFHVGNFERGDNVQNLAVDVDHLQGLYEKLEHLLPLHKISESELANRLDDLQGFRSGVNLLRPRVESIQNTLKGLEQQVNHTRTDLNVVTQLVDFLLSEVVPAEKAKPLRAIREQAEQLRDILDRKSEERLEETRKKISALQDRAVKEAVFWREDASQAAQAIVTELDADFQTIGQTGFFQSSVFDEIKYIRGQVVGSSGFSEAPSDKPADLLAQLRQSVAQIKTLLQAKSRLYTLVGPVLSLMKEAEAIADGLNNLETQLKKAIPDEGFGWPPTSQRFTGEDFELNRIRGEHQHLLQARSSITEVHEGLGVIIVRYRRLEDRLDELKRNLDQEYARYAQYADRYEASRKMWSSLRAKHKNAAIFLSALDVFLSDLDSKWAELESAYRKGRYPYTQALALLRNICRQLDENVVDYDADQVIDINGFIEKRK